jgi:hypothetical protein
MGDSPGTRDGGLLQRVAVVAGIIAALATAVGVGWSILHKDSTEVADYQRQVVATCEQVHTVLAKEHNEIFEFETGDGAGGPEDLIRVKKKVLLQVLQDNVDQARAAFEGLNQEAVPSSLEDQHRAAVTAQNTWYAAGEKAITTVRNRLPERARMSQVNELEVQIGGDRTVGARLNTAMTALAGRNCQPSP